MAMRIKFVTSAVIITGESYAQNQVAEVEDTLALALITGNVAIEMDATAPEGYLLGSNVTNTSSTTTTKTNNGKAKDKATAKDVE